MGQLSKALHDPAVASLGHGSFTWEVRAPLRALPRAGVSSFLVDGNGASGSSSGSGSFKQRASSNIANLERLKEWAWKHGAQGLDNVAFGTHRNSTSGNETRSLVANRHISAGEVALHIPRALSLYPEHPEVLKSKFGKIANGFQREKVFLAWQRRLGEKSSWAPMIRTLPTESDFKQFHPFYAKDDILDKFDFLPAVREAKRHRATAQSDWDKHGKEWQALAPGLTYDDYWWATLIFETRCYRRHAGACALVPIMDLANADVEVNASWQPQADGSWRIVMLEDIEPGQQFVENYRTDGSNEDFFWPYGFTLKENPNKPTQLPAKFCASQQVQDALGMEDASQAQLLKMLQDLTSESCGRKLETDAAMFL